MFLQLEKQDLKVQMVLWMLQRHLLVQLHTYVFFVPPVPQRKKKVSEEWNILDGTLQRSPSFFDNASVISEESFTLEYSRNAGSPAELKSFSRVYNRGHGGT